MSRRPVRDGASCASGCSPAGRRRRPGSARTPTPRRTWRSAATATGSSSSWPRTPRTPPPRRRPRAGCCCDCSDGTLVGGQHRRAARRGRRRVAVDAARLGQADDRDDETVGRFGVGFAAVLAVTDEPRVASTSGRGALVARRRAGGRRSPYRRSPTSSPAAAATAGAAAAVADDGAPEPASTPPSCCRCATPPPTDLRPAPARRGRRRAAARAARAGRGRRRGRRRRPRGRRRPTAGRSYAGPAASTRAARRPPGRGARPAAGGRCPGPCRSPASRCRRRCTRRRRPTSRSTCRRCWSRPSRSTRPGGTSPPGPLTDFLVGRGGRAPTPSSPPRPTTRWPWCPARCRSAGSGRRPARSGRSTRWRARRCWRPRRAARLRAARRGGRRRVARRRRCSPLLADVLPGLVADHRRLDRLGDTPAAARRRGRPAGRAATVTPSWWRGLYAALDRPGGGRRPRRARRAAGAAGRRPAGPRSRVACCCPATAPAAPAWTPSACGSCTPTRRIRLLLRLGAVEATPADGAGRPRRARCRGRTPADGPTRSRSPTAVLGLVAAAGVAPGELPWLAALPLPDDDGELVPAGDWCCPGRSWPAVDEDGSLGRPAADVLDRWGREVLAAAGVLADLTVLTDDEVTLDEDADHDLPDEPDWVDAVLADLPPQRAAAGAHRAAGRPRPRPGRATTRGRRCWRCWPATQRLRAAVVEPARAMLADGDGSTSRRTPRGGSVGTRACTAARPARASPPARPSSTGLYDVVDSDLDAAFLTASGCGPRCGAAGGAGRPRRPARPARRC